MNITLSTHRPADIKVDLLIVAAVGGDWKSGDIAELNRLTDGKLVAEVSHLGFNGGVDDVAVFQTHGALPARHVLVVGLGDTNGPTAWHKVAQTMVMRGRDLKATSAALAIPQQRLSAAVVEMVAEGIELSSYTFDRLKSRPDRRAAGLKQVVLLTHGRDNGWKAAVTRGRTVAAATCYARDLINLPAAIVTPAYLANEAKRIAKDQQLRVRILDASGIERAGMGALLGVAQGSAQPPRFIELVYRPHTRARQRVALAGKGVTFDSGGLSIKTSEAMQAQKRDMAGGAAVLAVMSVVRNLEVPAEVRAYVPATENMPGGRALKPGDVVRAYNGKSIEVLNTDAEGRLVLADALAYAAAAKPDVLIDLATLTAAVRTALGPRYAAVMGTNASLVQGLIAAARDCGENLWELPLIDEYRPDIDSLVADIKNTGEGAAATIIGGLFLREFVGSVPWAHIDFSSTATTDKAFACHPRGATGFGVRTLLRYLCSRT